MIFANGVGPPSLSMEGPPIWMPSAIFSRLIWSSPDQLLLRINSQAPDCAGAEDTTQQAADNTSAARHSLVGRFQDLRVASASRNPFPDSRSSASIPNNPFRGQTPSSQSRPTRGPRRAATPGPDRSSYNSETYQPANVGPYAAPTGSVGYQSGYPHSSSGPQYDPRSIHRSATTQPRHSRQAAERA
jgi:hypothetical protein